MPGQPRKSVDAANIRGTGISGRSPRPDFYRVQKSFLSQKLNTGGRAAAAV